MTNNKQDSGFNGFQDNFSFTQATCFALLKKTIEINLKKNEAKVCTKGLFKKKTVTLKLDEIDEHAEYFSYKRWGRYTLLGMNSLFLFVYLVWSFFDFSVLTKGWSIGVFFLCTTLICLAYCFIHTADEMIYFNLNRQASLALFVNKPQKSAYDEFLFKFNKVILYAKKKRELCAIIQGISTEFLKEDFIVFYTGELVRRGIDIHELLYAVKKKFLVSYVSEDIVGRRVN